MGITPHDQARRFLTMLYGPDAPGSLVLWTLPRKQSHWVPAADLDRAAAIAVALAQAEDVYFGVGLQDQEAALRLAEAAETERAQQEHRNPRRITQDRVRGYADSTIAIPGVWADVDIAGPHHKKPHLPPNEDAARTLLQAIGPNPTVVVFTGGGWHCYWLFRELWVFHSPQERAQAKALSQNWQRTIRRLAKAHGWEVDGTHDLSRVLRLPGTRNWKGVRPPA